MLDLKTGEYGGVEEFGGEPTFLKHPAQVNFDPF